MTNVYTWSKAMEMKKAIFDFLLLPRDTSLNIRVPSEWKEAHAKAWRKAQKQPGGERLQTFTDYVIERLTPKD